jgi:hypothetical protein
MLVREGAYETEVMETREFRLGLRFVVKCHTEEGEYACVLCSKFRDRDAICRTVESLVSHVGNFHEVGELERDADLREMVPVVEKSRAGSVVGSAVGGRERERERAASVAGSTIGLRERERTGSVVGSAIGLREREVDVREYR